MLLESYALREVLQFEPLVITPVFSWALYVSVLSNESVRLELPRYQGNKIDAHSYVLPCPLIGQKRSSYQESLND